MEFFLDNPWVNNVDLAKKVGVSERAVRHWKKHPIWEEIKTKVLLKRAEVLGAMSEQEKTELREKLLERQREIDIFRNALKDNTAQCFKVTNQAYRDLAKDQDAVKACAKATKSGVHVQSKNAMDGLKTIMLIDEHSYQLSIIIENFDDSEDDSED